MSDNTKLVSAASIMFDILLNVRDFLEDQSDVVDGANGPLPNNAMRLAQEIDEAIALVRGAQQ
jgi:hypothetical protein